MVTTPLTMTYLIPTGNWCGCSNVARSMTRAGSKIVTSAARPVLQAPAILDADLVGVHARHLLHGVGQRDGLQFADVAPEHARERAVVAGVRVGPAGRAIGVDRAPVGSDRRPRLLQDQLHVRLGVMEEDRGDAAVLLDQHVEQHIGGMAAARRDQLAHAPALERCVSFVFERDEDHAAPAVACCEVVVVPVRQAVHHLVAHPLARRRVPEALEHLLAAAVVRPRWHD